LGVDQWRRRVAVLDVQSPHALSDALEHLRASLAEADARVAVVTKQRDALADMCTEQRRMLVRPITFWRVWEARRNHGVID